MDLEHRPKFSIPALPNAALALLRLQREALEADAKRLDERAAQCQREADVAQQQAKSLRTQAAQMADALVALDGGVE